MQQASGSADAVYTILNFVPVLTLCAIVFMAGAFSQRVKQIERDMSRISRRLHKMQNVLTRFPDLWKPEEEEEGEKTE